MSDVKVHMNLSGRDIVRAVRTEERFRASTPRMRDVERTAPFSLTRDATEGGDGRTLDGYASVFNAVAIIDSWEGRFKEQFLSGSMKRSFRERTPLVQFDHGHHPLIGSLPVAHFEPGYPREEVDPERAPEGGAHVVAPMHESSLFDPVREVIASGTVNGMSIRFSPTKERWYWPDGKQVRNEAEIEAELYRTWREDVPDEELLRRDIVETDVLEMGPVVWPAYSATSIGVRSLNFYLPTRAIEPDTDPLAASGAPSADGEDPDAERQAAEASARNKQERAKRIRALELSRTLKGVAQ